MERGQTEAHLQKNASILFIIVHIGQSAWCRQLNSVTDATPQKRFARKISVIISTKLNKNKSGQAIITCCSKETMDCFVALNVQEMPRTILNTNPCMRLGNRCFCDSHAPR